MKQIRTLGFLCLLFLISVFSFAQGSDGEETVRQISQAIERGSARDLSKFFGQNADLYLPRAEGTFSRTQSEMILRDFFNRNRPSSFTIITQGVARDGSIYVIGNYTTRGGQTFRSYFLIKKISQNYHLHHLQFDLQ